MRAFARNHAAGLDAVELEGLSVTALGSFVALTPSAPSEALQRFAFSTVQAFELFRAPLSEADKARRLKSPLTPAQHAYLEAYGYPNVGDAFRFHMTLTGPLGAEERAEVLAALGPVVGPLLAEPRSVRDICLVGEDRHGMFHLLKRFPLAGGATT